MGPALGHSKELYPDCVIGSDYEFVFSVAIAASFNKSLNLTRGAGAPLAGYCVSFTTRNIVEDEKNWKLKLRYGKETSPYKHFTALGDGVVGELVEGFECPKGPAIMAIKTWATDANESSDMLRVIGRQIGFVQRVKYKYTKLSRSSHQKKIHLAMILTSHHTMDNQKLNKATQRSC
jgi:hypothetical protein